MAEFTYFEVSGDLHGGAPVTVGSSGIATISDDLAAGDTWLQSSGTDDTVQFSIDGTDYYGPAYSDDNNYEVEIYHVHVNGGGVIKVAYLTASGDDQGDDIDRIVVLSGSLQPGDTLSGFQLIPGQSKQELAYEDIPSAVICFTPGALITTPRGQVPVQDLRVGDLVVTADNGLQAIRWIGSKRITGARLQAYPSLRPIRIRRDALGPGMPDRDIWVSPQHRMLIRSAMAQLHFGEPEVLAPAVSLINDHSIMADYGLRATTYIHLLFDNHEVIWANGAPTESFHPGPVGLSSLTDQTRAEVFEIFPELAQEPSLFGPTARPVPRPKSMRALLGDLA